MNTITTNYTYQLEQILNEHPLVPRIVNAIAKQGGRALLVGGAVRDLLLGLPVKDLDIEVHGLPLADLEQCMRQFGAVSLVGKSFGVLRLHGLDVDWSLPRADSAGRKPAVALDPFMSIQDAFRRRDLTMNAMGIDLVTHELLDPFGGKKDLQQGILRAPDIKLFIEDPLRFYRVMQFIGRFGMEPGAELNNLCATMDITQVSVERIEVEFQKLLLRSKRPSLGIRWLKQIGRLQEVLPEVAATVGIPQEARWHPEGDVFEHTMQTVDAAATIDYPDDEQTKLILMYAALCHDLGKVETTREIKGALHSYGHDMAGAELAKKLLQRITRNQDLIAAVVKLVKYHMQPLQLIANKAKAAAYKRLAAKLAPEVSMSLLADLALADRRGRNPDSHEPLTTTFADVAEFIAKATQTHVLHEAEEPVLLGRDLLDVMQPGKQMGNLLKKAYEIQIEEGITDKEVLKRRVLK
jgi:tRNA nucleotidyltransferase (CCA-adding enzyme)